MLLALALAAGTSPAGATAIEDKGLEWRLEVDTSGGAYVYLRHNSRALPSHLLIDCRSDPGAISHRGKFNADGEGRLTIRAGAKVVAITATAVEGKIEGLLPDRSIVLALSKARQVTVTFSQGGRVVIRDVLRLPRNDTAAALPRWCPIEPIDPPPIYVGDPDDRRPTPSVILEPPPLAPSPRKGTWWIRDGVVVTAPSD